MIDLHSVLDSTTTTDRTIVLTIEDKAYILELTTEKNKEIPPLWYTSTTPLLFLSNTNHEMTHVDTGGVMTLSHVLFVMR